MTAHCPLCNASRRKVFDAVLLQKYTVDYFYCERCGLLQTEKPYWLEEAYAQSIADADTGIVARNQNTARKLACLLYFCFERDGHYIDVAGGYGMLTRSMRDIGFDFYWHDEYTDNLFARGFEAEKMTGNACSVTAFEVLEHVEEPVEFIRRCLADYGSTSFIFSTELFHGDPPGPGDWWYYIPDIGQHISFYQERTLQVIAKKLSLRLYSHRNMHLLTDRNISSTVYRALVGRTSWLLSVYVRLRMRSLTFADHDYISGHEAPLDRR